VILPLIFLLALAAGPAVTTVARGSMSAITGPREVVVRSSADWNALWKEHGSTQPVPAVDFSKELVTAVFLGSRPTGGFSVEVVGARVEGDALIVEYVEQRPGRGSIVTQVLTSPFHIVRLPAHKGPVRFQGVRS
jgi:PrcB C-terminal